MSSKELIESYECQYEERNAKDYALVEEEMNISRKKMKNYELPSN